jgi:hypothetical protein
VLRSFFWQRPGTKVSLAFLLIAFGLVLYLIASKGSPLTIFELIWLLLPPLFVLYTFILQPSRTAKKAVQDERLVAETTWSVGEAGVEISTRFGSTLLEWKTLNRLVRTRDDYLLLSTTNRNTFRFLPRRAFMSAQQEQDFQALARQFITKA